MKKNVGSLDRSARALAAVALATCSVLAPLPPAVRVPAFGLMALYMAATALLGSCLGYRLMGRSTCPVEPAT